MNSFYLFSMTKPPYLASIVHYWCHKFVKKFESMSYTNVSEIIKVAIKLIYIMYVNRWQYANYVHYCFYHRRMRIVVPLLTEIVKMLYRQGTYVLRATPVP